MLENSERHFYFFFSEVYSTYVWDMCVKLATEDTQYERLVMWLSKGFLGMTSHYSSFAREQSEAETSMEWKVCASFLQMGAFSFLASAVLRLMI